MPATGQGDPKPLLAAGLAAHKEGDLATAERIYRQVLRLWPEHPHALHLLGVVLDAAGRPEEGVGLIRRALPALDAKAHVHNNLGNALRHAGQPATARRHYERALALDGAYAQAHCNLGALLATPGPEEDRAAAREHLRRAVARDPKLVPAWLELARLSRREGKLPAAAEYYQRALAVDPENVPALIDLAAVLQVTLQTPRALPLLERACTLAPDSALAHFNRAQALAELGQGEAAEAAHRRVLALAPATLNSRLAVAKRERDRGDWSTWEATVAALASLDAEALAQAPPPFLLNLFPVPPAVHRQAARAYAASFAARARELAGGPAPRPAGPRERLRLGYLSADFRHHPVGHLAHGVYAALDPARCEAFAYSLVPVDDEVTAAVRAGCALFRDCARLDDRTVARQIADDGVDVLLDLTGYTTYSRPAILALRPAPLQVQHLGYVNTMGAAFLDYQIVDATVVGAEQRPFFDEALIFLPHCLFPVSPHGSSLGATAARPRRAEVGLPADAPVLCSFNDPAKLDPTTFDAWMAILRAVPAAVLWLYDAGQPALAANLRAEAARREVDPGRLVFSGRQPYPEHLARHQLADLFLDSFVYNGGATAVDALRQGLPILTHLGEAPLGRMGASVARAAGLADLVTTSTESYVELAVRLLTTPGALAALGERVRAARGQAPLFDLAGWVRGYEDGLWAAWEQARRGERQDIVVGRPDAP